MEISELSAKQRREIDKVDGETLSRLTEAYRAKYARMRTSTEALVAYIASKPDMSPAAIKKSKRYTELVDNIEQDLTDYSGYLRGEIDVTTRASLGTGETHALALIAAAGYAGRPVNLNKLPVDVVNVMLKFLAPDSALYQRIQQLAPYHADQIASALVDAVTLGINPLVTGAERIEPLLNIAYATLQKSAGQALTDALRMARTSQLWAYRESSRSIYVANQDVVTGWYWSAELDSDTCMSCVAQHGTFHTLDEQLDDHYNGRCAMIPAVRGQPSPIQETGVEWFDGLSTGMQKQMMGPEFYQSWQDGKFAIEDMSRITEDPTYGHMHTVTPLYVLTGDDNE